MAHDPSKAPLAAYVVFVENVTKMQPGEGLWKTAVKAPSTFAIHVPDKINHTVGYLAMMTYMAPPPAGHIFKIGTDGLVHEIEAMVFTTTYNAPTGWE